MIAQYVHVYDNRIEMNMPVGICGCVTCDDKCVIDNTSVNYFDRYPTRAAMMCFCIPVRPSMSAMLERHNMSQDPLNAAALLCDVGGNA